MALWHILVTKGRTSLMEEINDNIKLICDILSRVGHGQNKINKAVDKVAQAHDELTAAQAGFGEVMKAAEELMKANPTVECVECYGSGQVLVRLPSGGVSVLALSHWCELGMPVPLEPEPQVLPAFKPDVPLIPATEAKAIFERMGGHLTRNGGGFTQDVHDRILAGKPSQADMDLMAASHAWAETFDDPDLPEEGEA